MGKSVSERLADLHYRPSDKDEAIQCMEITNELLEALEDARRWLQGDKWRVSQIPEEVEAYLDIMDKIDKTIAKARGEK